MNQEKETVLVTGATGFLGMYLTERLVKKYRVLAMGRNQERGEALRKMGAVFCPGDFTDKETCASYFEGVSYVIHAGALSSVWGKWEDFYRTNVQGTRLVAELCLEYGVKRLVYVSSPSIYTGKKDQYQIQEKEAPCKNDLNYYIKSKLLAEQEIERWNKKGLETVILRPRGLIGIGDTSLVPRLLRANQKIGIPLFNSGANLVDLTSVENVALACELSLKASGASGGVFNITNGEPKEFRKLLEQFLRAIGERPHYRKLPFWFMYGISALMEQVFSGLKLSEEPPLTRYTVSTLGFSQTLDITKAREILKYKPEKTLAESIKEYGAWWKKENCKKPCLVTEVRLYHCGYCVNDLGRVFQNHGHETRKFPAMAVLIRHKKQGNILYDTGYSQNLHKGSLVQRQYGWVNPVYVKKGDMISEKLEGDGISPESIKMILLSHPHPDHIGGLSLFKDYQLIASRQVIRDLKHPGFHKLVFPDLVPGKIKKISAAEGQKRLKDHFLCRYFKEVYDLFGDGSIIGVILNGHYKGQMGIWVPDRNLFFAADACWGRDLVGFSRHMKLFARLIQQNYSCYLKTLNSLCLLKKEHPEIQLLFTHQKGRERTYV